MEDIQLPAMPASDAQSLAQNRYHGYYKVGARDFWGQAQVTQHVVEDFKKCQHYFMRQGNEIICKVCNIGWLAPVQLTATNGKLFLNNTQVQF